jgi:hypothetical protein
LSNFFLINSSETLPQRPNSHEVSKYQAVTGKKKEKVKKQKQRNKSREILIYQQAYQSIS